jgi:hypothetical protein
VSDKETAPWMREAATRAARVIWARRETISWGELTFEELVEIIAEECTAQAPTHVEMLIALQRADEMAKVIDDWTERGELNTRSALADARLNYGRPYEYKWATPQGTPTPDPFSKGYKHREGNPVSDACGDGKHSKCTQNYTKCHCTSRGGHTVPHAYADVGELMPTPDECPQCGSKDFWTVLPACHGGKAHKWHAKAIPDKCPKCGSTFKPAHIPVGDARILGGLELCMHEWHYSKESK